MMPRRIETEDLAVEHVRHPRQRMPVRGVARDEGPEHVRGRETAPHVKVLRDVLAVVVIDEVAAEEARIGERRGGREDERDPKPRMGPEDVLPTKAAEGSRPPRRRGGHRSQGSRGSQDEGRIESTRFLTSSNSSATPDSSVQVLRTL